MRKMRTTSAANIKRIKNVRQNQIPSKGTQLRKIYDLFMFNKGKIVQTPSCNKWFNRLVDIYGLDIRKIQNNKYILVGEWFGKVYIDYTKEATEEAGIE